MLAGRARRRTKSAGMRVTLEKIKARTDSPIVAALPAAVAALPAADLKLVHAAG
jgi:hypothetical protein